jgi:hypothetical protein
VTGGRRPCHPGGSRWAATAPSPCRSAAPLAVHAFADRLHATLNEVLDQAEMIIADVAP